MFKLIRLGACPHAPVNLKSLVVEHLTTDIDVAVLSCHPINNGCPVVAVARYLLGYITLTPRPQHLGVAEICAR